MRPDDDAVEMLFDEIALVRRHWWATVVSWAGQLAECVDHQAFNFGCRNTRDAAHLIGPLLQQRVGDVVAVSRAVLVRMRRLSTPETKCIGAPE